MRIGSFNLLERKLIGPAVNPYMVQKRGFQFFRTLLDEMAVNLEKHGPRSTYKVKS